MNRDDILEKLGQGADLAARALPYVAIAAGINGGINLLEDGTGQDLDRWLEYFSMGVGASTWAIIKDKFDLREDNVNRAAGAMALVGLVSLFAHPATRPHTWEAFVEAYQDVASLTESAGDVSCGQPETGYEANLRKMGELDYQPGIRSQIPESSPELARLVACMVDELPEGVGQVSSITSSRASFDECLENYSRSRCIHGADSGHFGFRDHYPEGSLAIDFGDEYNSCEIAKAAEKCGGNRALGPSRFVGRCNTDDPHFFGSEANNHVHVSTCARNYHCGDHARGH